MLGSEPMAVEQHVAASPDTVFGFFTSAERWLQWQGTAAQIDARPGGIFRVNVRGDGFASGEFVEIDPPRKVVFTWGWEMPDNPIRPGTTTVTIVLEPTDDGGTWLHLRHEGLPGPALEMHLHGHAHYLGRLAIVAIGGNPGPDPNVAVPS